jgi:hypothetical protein
VRTGKSEWRFIEAGYNMENVAYISFEINNTCNLAEVHQSKCPIRHPLRYRHSAGRKPLDTDTIIRFWEWARFTRKFNGVVNWNLYNEPTHAIDDIRKCMSVMRSRHPGQKFLLITNSNKPLEDVDQVLRTQYGSGGGLQLLDDRMKVESGDGAYTGPGCCRRGLGFEVAIDYYGNWCLCCNDWQNELSPGNIHHEDNECIYRKWKDAMRIYHWQNEGEFNALPRWCRRCLSVCGLSDVAPLLRAVTPVGTGRG